MFLGSATKPDIKNIKNIVAKNGIVTEDCEALINSGFVFPIKFSNKNIKYIMPKEFVKMAKEYDFSKVSEETIKICTKILESVILVKGIISYDDAYDYLIEYGEFNIKKNNIKTILKENFDNIFENYYIVNNSMDIKTAKNLLEIKEKEIDIPVDFIEMKEYFDMVMDLFGLFDVISNTDYNPSKYLKTLFYEPKDINSLVKTLNTELKIKNKDKSILRELLEENIEDFRYWIYNGEHESISSYLEYNEDIDIEDLPF